MHPALRKGPLFSQNTPIFHFLTKNTSHFTLFFYKKTSPFSSFFTKTPLPFYFLLTGLESQNHLFCWKAVAIEVVLVKRNQQIQYLKFFLYLASFRYTIKPRKLFQGSTYSEFYYQPITFQTATSGSVAEWLACWTQAQKGPGSNRSRDAVG